MTGETPTYARVAADDLRPFARAVLAGAGLREEYAATVADHLVDANLRGIDTHGVVRLEPYAERLERGGTATDPDVTVTDVGSAAAVVDADEGPGQVATLRAMEAAMDRADDAGGAFVGVRNSNHFGTASYYTNHAAANGCIGIAMTHAGPNVAPFGGTTPYFGTNPLAVALPGEEFPVSLDMATSATAKGSVILAEEEGETIPEDWAIDAEGDPITDPEAFHALRPMAGPKGYGLAFVIDAFCGLLLDTVSGRDVPSLYDDFAEPENLGHFVAAVDVDSFSSLAGFRDRLEHMVVDLKDVEPAREGGEVLVPGEPEARTKTERLAEGIPLGAGVWDTLADLADRYDREPPAER